jgi:predicted metalloendopeptidase
MTPQTVNSLQSYLKRNCISAAILQPFFNLKAEDAVNYGGRAWL